MLIPSNFFGVFSLRSRISGGLSNHYSTLLSRLDRWKKFYILAARCDRGGRAV